MRSARHLTIALTLSLLIGSSPSFAQVAGEDAGVAVAGTAAAPVQLEKETLPARLGKAFAFGVVVSVLLVASSIWRRRRRSGKRPR